MKPHDLIQRYLSGITTESEVQQLESLLKESVTLQDEFRLQAEIDAHLRQEFQSTQDYETIAPSPQDKSTLFWKLVSGLTSVAALLLAMFAFSFPPQSNAFAYPSLGELNSNVSWKGKDIWGAARQGDLSSLRRELESGAFVDARFDNELTPLHMASVFGHSKTVDLLLAEGASFSLTDDNGNNALHMAAFFGNTSIVKKLLAAGADAAARNHDGYSARDAVVVTWTSELEDYYRNLEKPLGTKLDLERIRKQRPMIDRLLSDSIAKANTLTQINNLIEASYLGNASAIKMHIELGTDLNQKETIYGNSPLALASIFGHSECAKLLIDASASTEIRNNTGDTALHMASFFCQSDIVSILLDADADMTIKNTDGRTPIDLVSAKWNPEFEAIYKHAYKSIKADLDVKTIKATRAKIAEQFKRHALKNDK